MTRRTTRRNGSGPTSMYIMAAASVAAWLSVAAPVSTFGGGQPADDDTLEWIDDYQAALALARESGRPLLVEFRCAP